MNGKREEKREAQINSKASRFQELCVCTHNHNEASRKNIPSSTNTDDAQRILPFFSFFRIILPRFRVELLLLSLTHPEIFCSLEMWSASAIVVKNESYSKSHKFANYFQSRSSYTSQPAIIASLVGNLAENKQLWRLQSHVTQLEKVRNWNLGRLHYGRSFVINGGKLKRAEERDWQK